MFSCMWKWRAIAVSLSEAQPWVFVHTVCMAAFALQILNGDKDLTAS